MFRIKPVSAENSHFYNEKQAPLRLRNACCKNSLDSSWKSQAPTTQWTRRYFNVACYCWCKSSQGKYPTLSFAHKSEQGILNFHNFCSFWPSMFHFLMESFLICSRALPFLNLITPNLIPLLKCSWRNIIWNRLHLFWQKFIKYTKWFWSDTDLWLSEILLAERQKIISS